MFPVFCVDDGFLGARASRPHNAWHSLSHLRHLDRIQRRLGSPSAWPLRLLPTWWLPAKSRGSSATPISNRMRAGRPRSQGMPNHSPLEGESQKPSRRATADAVGGWTPGRQVQRAATPSRFSTVPIRTAFPKTRRLAPQAPSGTGFRPTSGCRRPSPSYSARECGWACGRPHGRPPARARPSSRSVPSSPSRAKRGFPETSFGPHPHWSS